MKNIDLVALFIIFFFPIIKVNKFFFSMQRSAITNSSDLNLRSKGLNLSFGKIHKGCVKDAATKLSIGSIPSTYESIIYKSDNKKAFGTSQQRFYNKHKDQCQKIIDSHEPSFTETETTNTSQTCNTHNVIGYGPFISKSKRQWFRTIKTPGPGQYSWANQQQFKTQIARKCFTRQEKARKKLLFPQENKQNLIDIHQIDEKQINETPGPGQYQCEGVQNWKKTNKGWKSAFQTRVTRNHYIPASITPGPGVYDHCPEKKSPKQSNLEKKQVNKSPSKNKLLAEIIKEEKDEVPGPGSYNHELPDFKPLYQKIKLSKNFMAPLTAGKKNKVKGPTATYNVKRMFEDISPKLIESAVFMSESKRLPFQSNSKNFAQYINPPNQKRQNFHFNIRNEWM